MEETQHDPQETTISRVRAEIIDARRRLAIAEGCRRTHYASESVLRGRISRSANPVRPKLEQELAEVLDQIGKDNAAIDEIESAIAELEAEAWKLVEQAETEIRLPRIVAEVSGLWACRIQHDFPPQTLQAFAASLLTAPLRELGRQAQDGGVDIAAMLEPINDHYRI